MRFEELAPEHGSAFLAFLEDLTKHDPRTLNAWFPRARPWTHFELPAFFKEAALERRDWRPRASEVSVTRYVLTDDLGIAGIGILRFPLDAEVEASGGNFVVIVPPSRRGQGFATWTLNHLLFAGARAGLARALMVIPEDAVALRHAILRNRGEPETMTRYWLPLR